MLLTDEFEKMNEVSMLWQLWFWKIDWGKYALTAMILKNLMR